MFLKCYFGYISHLPGVLPKVLQPLQRSAQYICRCCPGSSITTPSMLLHTHTCTLIHTPLQLNRDISQHRNGYVHACSFPRVHSSSVHKMFLFYPSFCYDPASYSIWLLPVVFVVCCSPMQRGFVTSTWHTLARTENIFRYKMQTGFCGAVVIILAQRTRHPWLETEWKQVLPFS